MSALVSYVGKERPGRKVSVCGKVEKPKIFGCPDPLAKHLGDYGQSAALVMFRAGNDTREIASALKCTEAAAANALARARDAERGQ